MDKEVFAAQVVDANTHGFSLLADVPLFPGTLVYVEVAISSSTEASTAAPQSTIKITALTVSCVVAGRQVRIGLSIVELDQHGWAILQALTACP